MVNTVNNKEFSQGGMTMIVKSMALNRNTISVQLNRNTIRSKVGNPDSPDLL